MDFLTRHSNRMGRIYKTGDGITQARRRWGKIFGLHDVEAEMPKQAYVKKLPSGWRGRLSTVIVRMGSARLHCLSRTPAPQMLEARVPPQSMSLPAPMEP